MELLQGSILTAFLLSAEITPTAYIAIPTSDLMLLMILAVNMISFFKSACQASSFFRDSYRRSSEIMNAPNSINLK